MQNPVHIFEKLEAVEVSKEIDDSLSNCGLLEDSNGLFDVDSYHSLTQTIAQLTGMSFHSKIKQETEQQVNSESIWQCAKWAVELWDESLAAERLGRLLVANLVVDYIGYPLEILKLDIDDAKRRAVVAKVSTLTLKISMPEDADYAHQSQYRQYSEGVSSNNLTKLLSFFADLERGIGIYSLNPMPEKLIQLVFRIHVDGVMSLLQKGEPEIAELVFQALQKDQIVTVLADNYESEDAFPLARGFMILATRYNDVLEKEASLEIPYEKLGAILGKLVERNSWKETLVQIGSIGPIKWNPVFHYCCGLLVGKNLELLGKYLDTVEFSLEEKQYGNSFYNAIMDLLH